MEFEKLINERFSVRKFEARKIEQDVLDKILHAGKVAPSAANKQPWKVYVCRSDEALEKANQSTPCVFGATTVLLFVYDREKEWVHAEEPEFHAGVEDVSIAATHMMLAATDLGLGSLWINKFKPSATREIFALPDNEVPVLFLSLGYISPEAKVDARHTIYRPEEELFSYI